MEDFLEKKIELWVVGLIVTFLLFCGFVFGALVHHRANGGQRFGIVSEAALAIAEAPGTVAGILRGDIQFDDHRMHADYDDPAGFTFYKDVTEPQYVLVSRYDERIRWSVVELFKEGVEEPIHRWSFDDPDQITYESDNPFAKIPQEGAPENSRMMHPLITAEGRLFLHADHGAMYEFDSCAKPLWTNTELSFHHSLEQDADGNLWTPAVTTTKIKGQGWNNRLQDDHIVQLTTEGEILYSKSVLEILKEADLLNTIQDYDLFVDDPIHLNDIQPVLEDGEFIRKGDVFLSLGHLNMIMLFRPATNEVIWMSRHRMMHQHDIDLVGPDSITVFDNRRKTDAEGLPMVVGGHSEIIQFDLPSTTATVLHGTALIDMDIKTYNQGLIDAIDGAGFMIEDTAQARLVKFDAELNPEWIYVNRSESGELWTMNWSRYIPAAVGESVEKILGDSASCES